MAQDTEWRGWGKRFRAECADRGLNLAMVAERLDLAESTLRSWTNGTREINLADFFRLCNAADVDPKSILFMPPAFVAKFTSRDEKLSLIHDAWEQATPIWKEQLLTTAEAILKSRATTSRSRR